MKEPIMVRIIRILIKGLLDGYTLAKVGKRGKK